MTTQHLNYWNVDHKSTIISMEPPLPPNFLIFFSLFIYLSKLKYTWHTLIFYMCHHKKKNCYPLTWYVFGYMIKDKTLCFIMLVYCMYKKILWYKHEIILTRIRGLFASTKDFYMLSLWHNVKMAYVELCHSLISKKKLLKFVTKIE